MKVLKVCRRRQIKEPRKQTDRQGANLRATKVPVDQGEAGVRWWHLYLACDTDCEDEKQNQGCGGS